MYPIGNHFIFGFDGFTIPQWLSDFSDTFGLGGVIFFDYDVSRKEYIRNIESRDQVKKLCAEVHNLKSNPLVFIDQEGGKVRRLKEKLGFTKLLSAKALALLPPSERDAQFFESFREMKDLGIDVNLAPVVDIDYNPENPDIGKVERSYSASPAVVESCALSAIQAGKQTQLGLCLKHYPGMGGAKVNSHEELTDISAQITEEQLNLFHKLLGTMPQPSVLLSHGLVSQWHPSLPVSLQKRAVEDIRRHSRNACILTDDLQMQGLQKIMSTAEASQKALEAGVDMIIIGHNLMREEKICYQMAEDLTKKYDSGQLIVDSNSLRRIQALKGKQN